MEIEKRSFFLIQKELKKEHPKEILDIVTRVIHATADFEYEELLIFSNNPIDAFKNAIKNGENIVTDTNMIKAGINKSILEKYNVKINCYVEDEDVKEIAQKRQITRSIAAMEKALNKNNSIFVIGNAPTALFTLCNYIEKGTFYPNVVIGVPVGFVGAKESKELLLKQNVPSITTKGRKGGSTVAVAIVNALLKMVENE
ncbi:precorrin-8X methylmutase [Thermosipho melanesiensis]|nr:precorrin-8X methylmutase [Thermosipho melanesiensis]